MSQGALCPCHVDSRTAPLAPAKPATGRGPPSKAADTLCVMESQESMATFVVFHGHKPASVQAPGGRVMGGHLPAPACHSLPAFPHLLLVPPTPTAPSAH